MAPQPVQVVCFNVRNKSSVFLELCFYPGILASVVIFFEYFMGLMFRCHALTSPERVDHCVTCWGWDHRFCMKMFGCWLVVRCIWFGFFVDFCCILFTLFEVDPVVVSFVVVSTVDFKCCMMTGMILKLNLSVLFTGMPNWLGCYLRPTSLSFGSNTLLVIKFTTFCESRIEGGRTWWPSTPIIPSSILRVLSTNIICVQIGLDFSLP